MYIVSHTKGLAGYFTSFFFYRPSLLLNTTFSTSFVSLGPTGAWPLPCAATFPCSIGFLWLLYHLLQHSPCTPIPPWAPCDKPSHRHTVHSVGGIMVLCVTHLYKPVLALRTSQSLRVRNPTTGMLF